MSAMRGTVSVLGRQQQQQNVGCRIHRSRLWEDGRAQPIKFIFAPQGIVWRLFPGLWSQVLVVSFCTCSYIHADFVIQLVYASDGSTHLFVSLSVDVGSGLLGGVEESSSPWTKGR